MLNDFVSLRLLGGGGFGFIYKCKRKNDQVEYLQYLIIK